LSFNSAINDFYLDIQVNNIIDIKSKLDHIIIIENNPPPIPEVSFKNLPVINLTEHENIGTVLKRVSRGEKYKKIIIIPSNILIVNIKEDILSDSKNNHILMKDDYILEFKEILDCDLAYFNFLHNIPQISIIDPTYINKLDININQINNIGLLNILKHSSITSINEVIEFVNIFSCTPKCFNTIGKIKPEYLERIFKEEEIKSLKSWSEKPHDNKVFWNYRYATNKNLGSGIGSRGKNLNWKRNLVETINVSKNSILDVGCGDFEVLKSINFNKYTGIDISKTAINIAKENRPDLEFILFRDKYPDLEKHDIVFCFDVLIHQDNSKKYYALLDYIIQKSKKIIIVSGYVENLNSSNPMIFFYENIIQSLSKNAAIKNIKLIGNNKPIALLIADKGNVENSFYEKLNENIKAEIKTVF